MTQHESRCRDTVAACAFGLAVMACALGLVLCFVKSPQHRSAEYLAMAQASPTQNRDVAVAAAWEATRLNPRSAQAWETLSRILQQNGEIYAARKALTIAAKLNKSPSISPVYAMPAEFSLSFLAAEAKGL